jgi:hypothetical protein
LHWYSSGLGQNHKLLLRRVEPAPLAVNPDGFATTLRLLREYRDPCQFLRLDYLRRRARRAYLYTRELLLAPWFRFPTRLDAA